MELGQDANSASADNVEAESTHAEPISTTTKPQDVSTTVKAATDRVLHFLSHASNETLGACIAGLGATTYLILGRVGLILIGAVGGIVLHATWEGRDQDETDKEAEQKRRRELGIDVVRRVLEWRHSQVQDSQDVEIPEKAIDFSDFSPETASALNVLTDAVIRDYVKWWYSPILPTEEAFPAASRDTFSGFLLNVSNNVARKRPADSFLEFVTNSSSIFIVFLNELSSAVWASPSIPLVESIEKYLSTKPDSNLANIVDEEQQTRKLDAVADDILACYLDARVYSCPPATVFLRKVLAQLVLGMTLQRCSQSDWINEWIVYLLEEGGPELLTAVDASVEVSVVQATAKRDSAVAVDNSTAQQTAEHKRNRSRAEEAMEEALQEAQRLTQLMAEEDAKRNRDEVVQQVATDDTSDSATQGIQTPTSSQSDPQSERTSAVVETNQPDPVLEAGQSAAFTNFDQIVPHPKIPTALLDDDGPPPVRREVLTLHKASVSIFDDGGPGDRKPFKSKPIIDYMIQIEPPSTQFSGWMIARTYSDFETLHEVLRRISTISGAVTFSEAHTQLPGWKGRTKSQLTQDLDRYLMDAVQFEPLAESEGMKRFLEKERGMTRSPKNKQGFWAGPAALENMGKGVLDVLSKAPKNVAGGGKAVFGGVSSVLGGGPARISAASPLPHGRNSASVSSFGRPSSVSYQSGFDGNSDTRPSVDSSRTSTSDAPNLRLSRPSSMFVRSQSNLDVNAPTTPLTNEATVSSPNTPQTPQITLPPLPSAIPDDYDFMMPIKQDDLPAALSNRATAKADVPPAAPPRGVDTTQKRSRDRRKERPPLTGKETQVTIELMFAVINELYTLSSAWTLRRTLLNAARSYLLRPGNPQLESIRQLLQETVLESNTSDAGIAAHILKMRENALPTEEELKAWPKPRTDEEKERLRIKARKLAVTKAIPQALTSVMGTAASGEAVGRVFDALQIEKVARGLMFGLMLQAVRALTQ